MQKNIVKHSKNPKAPYSKEDRHKRRQEVFRLHFELGYPGLQIAELMKVDKNTIYKDIEFLYNNLIKENKEYDHYTWYIKQVTRHESQRVRLMELLRKENSFESKLSLERLILELDSKLSNLTIRIKDVKEDTRTQLLSAVNDIIDKHNKKEMKRMRIGGTPNTINTAFQGKKLKIVQN